MCCVKCGDRFDGPAFWPVQQVDPSPALLFYPHMQHNIFNLLKGRWHEIIFRLDVLNELSHEFEIA